MSNDWDFYFCKVDNKPASIYVDLGLNSEAPIRKLPYMAYVSLIMNHPRDDGLSSQEEYETLNAIEDCLREKLENKETLYVGRSTSDNNRDFFFYIANPANWTENVSSCMSNFPNYKFYADTQDDKEWSTFLNFLYPTDKVIQSISNRRVVDKLESEGDELTQAREIDHWIYFEDSISRDAFVEEAIKMGYKVRIIRDPDEDIDHFSAQLWREDIPSYREIDNITFPLYNLATKYKGEYDGWECEIIGK